MKVGTYLKESLFAAINVLFVDVIWVKSIALGRGVIVLLDGVLMVMIGSRLMLVAPIPLDFGRQILFVGVLLAHGA